jgi:riboflavin biosynthesis pyrimidine reductase
MMADDDGSPAMTRRPYMRMLFPEPVDDVDPAVVYADVPHHDLRPAVRLNMIVSVDGGTSWNGVSGGLGGPADKALFGVLRSLADVVLVASATMRGENYGPAVLPAPIQEVRRQRGQTPVPRIAVVSRACDFDWTSPFFTAATERPIVFTVASAPESKRTRAAEVAEVIIAGQDDVDLHRAVSELGSRGATNVLAEGGPTLNGQLARAGLLDEVCVTLAPLLASGDAKRIIAGSTLDALEPVGLCSICEDGDYLFLRYRPR